jgi:hypothetical protein
VIRAITSADTGPPCSPIRCRGLCARMHAFRDAGQGSGSGFTECLQIDRSMQNRCKNISIRPPETEWRIGSKSAAVDIVHAAAPLDHCMHSALICKANIEFHRN